MNPVATVARRALRVRGLVQGVGFRPFVHGLATGLGLSGHVGNDGAGVFVEVEGPPEVLEEFERRLVADRPVLAAVEAIERADVPVTGRSGFTIVASVAGATTTTLVPPDVTVCDACLAEMADPTSRRFRYPFTTCTDCGPRFTIVTALPYDRPFTTMASFALCERCAAEYHDPTDRRFHAQPLACPDCGPHLSLVTGGEVVAERDDALVAAQRLLAEGGVVAVKGIGGYHLACDAGSDAAVARLRTAKHRSRKPFAVMARDLDAVRAHCRFDDGEAAVLVSAARPIVLLVAHPGDALARRVAPGNGRVGVMLPSSPLHHLLLHDAPNGPSVPPVLVMTSGNRADEPICTDDAAAFERLGDLVDAFLTHDRPIHVPCDDSVVRVRAGREYPVRRSRGYAPLPVSLPVEVPATLAVGGELKTTFCLADGRHGWMSQHLGDMGNLETLEAFERSVEQFERCYGVVPVCLAADAHPGYLTSRWAQQRGRDRSVPVHRVQHHHAHVAAVLADAGWSPQAGPVIGLAFDGTGYGTDGTIWGGEVLVAGYGGFARAGHLATVPLPGGDAAVRHPARVALVHLQAAQVAWAGDLAPVAAYGDHERALLARQLERSVNCVATSSMGRLFDAVGSLVLGVHEATYEAQAAIELEAAVEVAALGDTPYAFALDDTGVADAAPVVRAVVADLRAGLPAGVVAARFHEAVASLALAWALATRRRTGLEVVALSGGVFQNVTLVDRTVARLTDAGFTVLTHRHVPPNDAGLALGQAVVAGLAHAGPGAARADHPRSR